MAKKKLQCAIIGGGAIAQACHAPGYLNNKYADLVAFCDPSLERHDEMKEIHPNIRGYLSAKDMFAVEDLDAVSVCSPNKFHAAHTVAALKAGCHVLCEKPMALTLREADRMNAAAKAARKKLMIAFSNRLIKGPMRCKELIKQKAIGKPFMIRVRFAHGGPYPGWAKSDWFYQPTIAAGGAMFDMGIHAIDLSLWLLGPAKTVMAKADTLVKKIPVDDNAVILMELGDRAMGYIEVGWSSKPGFTGLEIYGTEGSLICDYNRGLQLCRGRASAGKDSEIKWEMIEPKAGEGGWVDEIDHWIDVVRGKKKLEMDGAAGRAALEVALAAYKSSDTGRRINVGKRK